jgi:hypothetical protein
MDYGCTVVLACLVGIYLGVQLSGKGVRCYFLGLIFILCTAIPFIRQTANCAMGDAKFEKNGSQRDGSPLSLSFFEKISFSASRLPRHRPFRLGELLLSALQSSSFSRS